MPHNDALKYEGKDFYSVQDLGSGEKMSNLT